MATEEDIYLLGVNQQELERLRFQHGVWGGITRDLFARLGVGEGWKCLDVGAGPGFVTDDLRALVGERGEVWALEPSQTYLRWLDGHIKEKRWNNIRTILGGAENAALPEAQFDLVFIRWVVAFVPDAERFLQPLVRTLKPGGIIAIQDYYYEGLSLYPHGGAFDGMADIVRAYYASAGGDAYVTGRLPALFRNFGMEVIEYAPHQLAGGPQSGVFQWGERFFVPHIPVMTEKELITKEQERAFLDDWFAHRSNPDALFFSPIVVDVAAKRKG